jgi:hypothetical protein
LVRSLRELVTGRFDPFGCLLADPARHLRVFRNAGPAGFTTICVKPSQFLDDQAHLAGFCRDLVAKVSLLA